MDEAYADLPVIQRMVDLSSTDEKSAMRIFRVWNMLRGREGAAEHSISNLLLSSAEIQDGTVVVDWGMLQRNLRSFRDELTGIFSDLMSRVHPVRGDQLRIVGGAQPIIGGYRERVNNWMADHLGLNPASGPFNQEQP